MATSLSTEGKLSYQGQISPRSVIRQMQGILPMETPAQPSRVLHSAIVFSLAGYTAESADGISQLVAQQRFSERSLAPALAPVRALVKLKEYWGASEEQMRGMCGLLPGTDHSFGASLVEHFRVPDIKDRMRILMVIRTRLAALFNGNQASERAWMRTPWALIEDQEPLEFLAGANFRSMLRMESLVRELVGG